MEIGFYGAFVLNHRVVLHAIDATPARWRGDAGSLPLDRAPDALVDFHTGANEAGARHARGEPLGVSRRVERRGGAERRGARGRRLHVAAAAERERAPDPGAEVGLHGRAARGGRAPRVEHGGGVDARRARGRHEVVQMPRGRGERPGAPRVVGGLVVQLSRGAPLVEALAERLARRDDCLDVAPPGTEVVSVAPRVEPAERPLRERGVVVVYGARLAPRAGRAARRRELPGHDATVHPLDRDRRARQRRYPAPDALAAPESLDAIQLRTLVRSIVKGSGPRPCTPRGDVAGELAEGLSHLAKAWKAQATDVVAPLSPIAKAWKAQATDVVAPLSPWYPYDTYLKQEATKINHPANLNTAWSVRRGEEEQQALPT